MRCESCGELAVSVWISVDERGDTIHVCWLCIESEADLRIVRSENR